MDNSLSFSRFFWPFLAGEYKLHKSLDDYPTTKPKALIDHEQAEDNLMQINKSKLLQW